MSPTILFLHAHPDDESILTGSTMAKAHSLGFRTICAFATRGDAGETNQDLGGQTLGERREEEARSACAELGIDRVLFLGWDDSGMAGTESTERPTAFCNADLNEVDARLSIALVNETIDMVIGYDRNGTYGHPDHIQVHHAARHAAPALRASWVLDATYSRDYLQGLENSGYGEIGDSFALPHAELTHYVEGSEWFAAKIDALKHHQSQTPEDWNPDAPDMVLEFEKQFGTEWFVATAVTENPTFEPFGPLFDEKEAWPGTIGTVTN